MAHCDVCREVDGDIELPGGLLWDSELVVAFHVPPLLEPEPLIGHLLITVRRHADTWADLTPAEAPEVGVAAAALAGPLRATTGAERIYSAVIGHHSAHFHLHVFPRHPGTPESSSSQTQISRREPRKVAPIRSKRSSRSSRSAMR